MTACLSLSSSLLEITLWVLIELFHCFKDKVATFAVRQLVDFGKKLLSLLSWRPKKRAHATTDAQLSTNANSQRSSHDVVSHLFHRLQKTRKDLK